MIIKGNNNCSLFMCERGNKMYKVIIVDDEEIIRNGLSMFISGIGSDFEVVASFDDGLYAIEYMKKNNDVDVVITDIKMTKVSGLEVAKYVNENKPSTKVVIVSGYREFEYAQKAIEYNVENYLLKPTRMNEAMKVLNNLKKKLDEEREYLKNYQTNKSRYDDLLPILEEQFFTELIMGSIKDEYAIKQRATLLGIDKDITDKSCCIINIIVKDYDSYVEGKWEYGKDRLEIALRNFINIGSEKAKYYQAFNRNGFIKIIAISNTNVMMEELEKESLMHFNNVRETVKEVFGLDVEFEIEEKFDALMEITTYSPRFLEKTDINELHTNGNCEPENDLNDSSSTIITMAKEYIEQNYAKDISLEDVANHVFLSAVYLSKLFKQKTGENFSDYLIEVRMNNAIKLLKDRKLKIHEISELVGYKSDKYFIRLFKKYTGSTPKEYYRNAMNSGSMKAGR